MNDRDLTLAAVDAWLEELRALAGRRAVDVAGPTWDRVLGPGEIPTPGRNTAGDPRAEPTNR